MEQKSYRELAAEAATRITEVMPWDVEDLIAAHPGALLLDVREREEFARARIPDSVNVPRGILESAAEWNYAETEPRLVRARAGLVLVICRSGNRSAIAAEVLEQMGFSDVRSVRLGIKGWNDADQPLTDATGAVLDGDAAIGLIEQPVRPDQLAPTAE